MTLTRGIPISLYSAIEVIAAPAIMVAPFALGFGPAATAIAVAIGAIVLTLALQVESPRRAVPLSAHAELRYLVAFAAMAAGLVIAVVIGSWAESVFLVGIGAAQVALTASTRFTVARDT
jgi:hypothetical protein